MEDPPRPIQGSARPGFYSPATNIFTLKTNEDQTSSQDFGNIVEVKSNGQASISISSTSTNTNKAVSATKHGYNNLCCAATPQNCQDHSSLESSDSIEMSGRSRNQPFPNSTAITSSAEANNRKRSESSYKITQEIKRDRKFCKFDICDRSDKNVAICSEQDLKEDKTLEFHASRQVTLDRTALTSFDGQNIDSNISISKTDEYNKVAKKISDSEATKRGSIWSVEDILAAPGPSRFHGNQKEPKILDEKLKTSSGSKIQSVVSRRIIACLYCGEGIDKHTKIKSEKKEYCCCVCEYKTKRTPHTLQKHIRIHCSKNHCIQCSQDYTEGTLHVSQHKCQLCSVSFHCRTLLDKHLLELHLEHFRENCWECFEPINDHFTRKEWKILYSCCLCGYETKDINCLMFHNEGHRPKYFCKICKEEYKEKMKGFHNIKHSCFVCKEEFTCAIQLEDHYKNFSCSKYFIEHCWLCNEMINEHSIHREEKQYYKCCACQHETDFPSRLKTHIIKHTGLRFFKCDTCGKRFTQRRSLDKHLEKCIPLPSLCKTCGAKFPRGYLTKHHLEKHRQMT